MQIANYVDEPSTKAKQVKGGAIVPPKVVQNNDVLKKQYPEFFRMKILEEKDMLHIDGWRHQIWYALTTESPVFKDGAKQFYAKYPRHFEHNGKNYVLAGTHSIHMHVYYKELRDNEPVEYQSMFNA